MSEENTTTNNSTDASATKTVIEVPLEKKKSISASSLVANAKKNKMLQTIRIITMIRNKKKRLLRPIIIRIIPQMTIAKKLLKKMMKIKL